MQWYPWLTNHYKNIIKRYKNNKFHPVLLVKGVQGIGISSLIWIISRWLFCSNKIAFKSCGICLDCSLMLSQNHPDYYFLKKNKKDIGIEEIRTILDEIFKTSKQGGLKIVWIHEPTNLTNAANNAILKTLEEPPNNTLFFFTHTHIFNIISHTLYSRCCIYQLHSPNYQESIEWMIRNTKFKKKKCEVALNISNNLPIHALKLLNSNLWNERVIFFEKILLALTQKNFLFLLTEFHENNKKIKIEWICSILFDVIKYNFNAFNFICNHDQIKIIKIFSQLIPNEYIDEIIRSWLHCRKLLLTVPGINLELVIAKELIKWTVRVF
ncbi:DNA polymerase III subunit delta' [Buchnera aphidicola (Thelaxes suberi)]